MTRMHVVIAAVAVASAFAAGNVFSSTETAQDPHAEARAIADRLAACVAEERHDDLKTEMWDIAVHEAVVGELGDQLSIPYKRLCEGLGARTKTELLKAEAAGPSIVRYSYAEFHTRGVVVWTFEFFKPADQWKLHAYGFGPLRMETGVTAPAGQG